MRSHQEYSSRKTKQQVEVAVHTYYHYYQLGLEQLTVAQGDKASTERTTPLAEQRL